MKEPRPGILEEWHIRSVPVTLRDGIVLEAAKRRITVAAYLETLFLSRPEGLR